MNQQENFKKYGWIWIVLSPILMLMASISTVESLTTYYIQLICFSVIAVIGFVAGVAALLKAGWAPYVLKYLSWLGFVYFSGSGVMILLLSMPKMMENNLESIALLLSISLAVIATGLPFYFMAKNVGKKINAEQQCV